MRELMLELLTYEPFRKFLPEEKIYIDNILSGNYQQPQSMLHDLFSGFHYCVQQEAFDDVDWLRQWKAAYGRTRLPLLFKKICFYLMVKGTLSGSDFMGRIGLQVTCFRKWEISPQFRRYAEANTYSVIKSFRLGVKRPYIVSLVKRLYHEAGRQESNSKKLKKLPTFVDVFAGTAGVAASVVSEGCPSPIVNDYDPVLVCFAWAFTFYQSELRKRIAEFHNALMKQDFESTNWSYSVDDYERHFVENDPRNVHTNPKAWDNKLRDRDKWLRKKVYGESKEELEYGAQRHQELIIRTRSRYMDVNLFLKKLSDFERDRLRDIEFNKLPKHLRVIDAKKNPVIDDILDNALALFYFYSFPPVNGHIYDTINVSADSYISYMERLQVDLDTARKEDVAEKAKTLLKLDLEASLLSLESTGHFSRYLRGSKFYCKDFREILQNDTSDRVYYLDSPYFLTVGYDVGFLDNAHKDMLDLLRKAEFKWIFSMQYYPSKTDASTTSSDENKRKKQPHIIKDYGAYYRGFCAPFQLDADQRFYVATGTPMEDAKKLYAILFDVETAKRKKQKIYSETHEMLVVNFNCLSTIPLHDSAVVLPFDLFLQCADDGVDYTDIVERAIAWRKDNIEKNYAGQSGV